VHESAHAAYRDKAVEYLIPLPAGGKSAYVARLQSEIDRPRRQCGDC